MRIRLKPFCIIDTVWTGDIRITIKEYLTDEIIDYIANKPFDYIILGNGDWRDIDKLIKYKNKIKELRIDSESIDWKTVSEFSCIQDLSIAGRYKCDLEFKKFKKLKHLRTYWNDGYEKTVNNLNTLKSLVITQYREKDFTTLKKMDKLEFLEMVHSRKLESLKSIDNFKNLKCLELIGCSKLTDIKALSKLPKLEFLHIDKCKMETDYSALGDLKVIKDICFGGEMKDIQWVKKLKTLTKLRFNCKLEDGNLDFLYDMPNLQLIVFNNKRNFSIKLKDIQKHLENKGYNQDQLRGEMMSTSDAYK